MNISVDLRSLHTDSYSGVEYFTIQTLEHLLAADPSNQYLLFYNGFKERVFKRLHFLNVTYKQTRIPNRLLNLSMILFNWPKLDAMAGGASTFLMPNPNLVRLRSTTKLVLVIHDLSPVVMPDMYSLKYQLWDRIINIPKLCQRADKILAVSHFTKQSLINDLKIPEEKISVAHLGVDKDRYRVDLPESELRSVRNRYGVPGKYILFVGTIEPRKNLTRLLDAFETIDDSLSLVICGKLGWRYREIIDKLNNHPKRKQILYLGYVPEKDKPALMKLATLLVWPSLYEGFGLPIIEAMAVGTPVVTSSVSSLPEVAGDAAILVDPYQTSDIAQACNMLALDKNVRETYILKGLDRVKQFSWQQTAQTLQQLLS